MLDCGSSIYHLAILIKKGKMLKYPAFYFWMLVCEYLPLVPLYGYVQVKNVSDMCCDITVCDNFLNRLMSLCV